MLDHDVRLHLVDPAHAVLWHRLMRVIRQHGTDGVLVLDERLQSLREVAFAMRADEEALRQALAALIRRQLVQQPTEDSLAYPAELMARPPSSRADIARANGAKGGRPPKVPAQGQGSMMLSIAGGRGNLGETQDGTQTETQDGTQRTYAPGFSDEDLGSAPSRVLPSYLPTDSEENQAGRQVGSAEAHGRGETQDGTQRQTQGVTQAQTQDAGAAVSELERLGRQALDAGGRAQSDWGPNSAAIVQRWLGVTTDEALILRTIREVAARQKAASKPAPGLTYYFGPIQAAAGTAAQAAAASAPAAMSDRERRAKAKFDPAFAEWNSWKSGSPPRLADFLAAEPEEAPAQRVA